MSLLSESQEVLSGAGPLARRLHQRHVRIWHDRVDTQTTGPQYSVLAVLVAHDELALTELTERTSLDKSTLTPLLARLESRGLIALRRDERDQRRRLAAITQAGKEVVRDLTPRAAAASDELLAPLAAEDRELLLSLLSRALG